MAKILGPGAARIALILAAVAVAAASLTVSRRLARALEQEERRKVEVWAEAMKALDEADADTDLALVLKVINDNSTIPVVVVGPGGAVQTHRNVDIPSWVEDSAAYVAAVGADYRRQGRFVPIYTAGGGSVEVCYGDSTALKQLEAYPYVQLAVVAALAFMALFALLAYKRAEQNSLWVGLSKETAHQLGTPISSLMAWTEVLRDNHPGDEMISEMGRDVDRLRLVADRFSKIGSAPELSDGSVSEAVGRVADYMSRRAPSGVAVEAMLPAQDVRARINAPLFEWVLENLCKNAIDAVGRSGRITIAAEACGGKAAVEVADTGKGIRKKDAAAVFRPGYTTKERGWGLGLSLAKRIVEEYHKGRIFVKWSEPGRGTVFRLEI